MATIGEPSGIGAGVLGRRTYLKLAGAAAIGTLGFVGTASGASVEEIVVPAGGVYKKTIQDGETFENKLIDITAPGASARLLARGRGGWEIRNVGVKGSSTSADRNVITASAPAGSTGTIENVYLGDGAVSGGQTAIFVPPAHAGTLTIRGVNLQGWPDNAIYASTPGKDTGGNGAVRIDSCYARNNNIASYRLGTDSSSVSDSVAIIDAPVPANGLGQRNARAIWVREGGNVAIDGCNVYVNSNGKFGIAEDKNQPGAAIVAQSPQTHVRNDGGVNRFYGNVVGKQYIGESPDLSRPAGVPQSAEEAASAGS